MPGAEDMQHGGGVENNAEARETAVGDGGGRPPGTGCSTVVRHAGMSAMGRETLTAAQCKECTKHVCIGEN